MIFTNVDKAMNNNSLYEDIYPMSIDPPNNRQKSSITVPLGIRFTKSQHDRLKALAAEQEDQSVSPIVRLAVERYFNEIENPPSAS